MSVVSADSVSCDRERDVPIRSDTRTLEQFQRDMVQNLERKQRSSGAKIDEKMMLEPHARRGWFDEVDEWISETRKRWSDDMQRMQRDIFTLLPVTPFDMEPLLPFTTASPFGHVPLILRRMERQMDALRNHLCTFQPDIPTIYGTSDAIIPFEDRSGGILDFLKDAYEVGEDGKLHFKVRFNVRDFGPQDVKVTTSKNRLTVSGRKASQSKTSSSVSEFSRTVYFPDSVDDSAFTCHMTGDGVLMVEAPVRSPDYKSLTFSGERQLAVKPQTEQALILRTTGIIGPQVITNSPTDRKVHVEVPVEPGFNADELHVRVDANCVVVSGRKHETEGSGDSHCIHSREFSRSYTVPETIDPLSLKTQLFGNTLVIEAPLLQST